MCDVPHRRRRSRSPRGTRNAGAGSYDGGPEDPWDQKGKRPFPAVGSYYRTPHAASAIRCKAYTGPPVLFGDTLRGGMYITTIAPGTYLGPVAAVSQTEPFTTINVANWWINIWHKRARDVTGIHYAYKVPDKVVRDWVREGWEVREWC